MEMVAGSHGIQDQPPPQPRSGEWADYPISGKHNGEIIVYIFIVNWGDYLSYY